MNVPMTLFLLGASLARLDIKLGRESGLPVFALLSVCAAKMLLLPTIGVFITRAMVTGGLIHPESKVQIFVAIFVSGTPSSLK
jgi:auxin efflux carrier family protein